MSRARSARALHIRVPEARAWLGTLARFSQDRRREIKRQAESFLAGLESWTT